MNTPERRLLLVDGSSFLYRAFHALPPLTNARGEPTGAVYGVVNMLRGLCADWRPTHVAVVFDAPGRTFRDDLFAEYKATRPPMPDDLAAQVGPLHALVRALGWPLLQVPGVEADDVIGTLAGAGARAGCEVAIATSDKDMAQLVGPRITLHNTMSRTVLDRAGVVAKFGVPPERIVDYLALVGDTSDNIPGVPKVGPKTAAKWLAQYGTLDAIVAHAAEIPGAVGESLRAALDNLALSRELATIRADLDLPVGLDDLRPGPPDVAALREWYARLEFRSWLRALDEAPADTTPATPAPAPAALTGEYETVRSLERLADWIARLRAAGRFAFDTETTSLDPHAADLVGVSFAVERGRAAYVPVGHTGPEAGEQLATSAVLAALRPLLEDAGVAKLGHHLKYDWQVLARHGIAFAGIADDTLLESFVLDSAANRHDLDTLIAQHLQLASRSYESVTDKGRLPFAEVPVAVAADYACEDVDAVLRVDALLRPRLAADPALERVYADIELPLLPVLAQMERAGVLVDAGLLHTQSAELATRLAEIELAAHREAGAEFNLASPKQLQEILFAKLGLPVTEKTPGGQPSTAESVLSELADQHPLPALILEHRMLAKLRSTYTDKLPGQINPLTGRVHTSYHQGGAATGRLSSSDPNLQNIPIRTPEGRRIRQAFIAPPGQVLVAADYSQIELRILAHLSGDGALLAAFASGGDVHRATAAEIFGLAPADVAPEQRRAAKAINFGLVYGMSAFGLARQIGVSRADAQDYMNRYFTRYTGVRDYMDELRAQAREQGCVQTLFGRRLQLPEIKSRNPARRAAAERTAINAPMQGTAADIIKRAMVRVARWLDQSRLPARMILQVHDELVLEVEAGAAGAVAEGLRHEMAAAAELRVPLDVSVGTGTNWDEAHG